MQGLTHNGNESFHAKMWNRAHKIKFARTEIINSVAQTTIPDHNFGYYKATLLDHIQARTEALNRSLELQDTQRKMNATTRKIPKNVKITKKNERIYTAGGF